MPTQDAAGQQTDVWTVVASGIKCRLGPAEGSVIEKTQFVTEKSTHVLFIRKQKALTMGTADHRVDVGGEKFNFLLISQLDSSKFAHHLEIMLEKIS